MRLERGIKLARRAAVAPAFLFLFLFASGLEKTVVAKDKDAEIQNKQKVQAGFDAWRNGTGSPFFDTIEFTDFWTRIKPQ